MVVTLSGIVIEVSFGEFLNAIMPIDVTLLGMVTPVSSGQALNALLTMDVTSYVLPSYVTCDGITMSPLYLSPTPNNE